MADKNRMPDRLQRLCGDWSARMDVITKPEARRRFFESALPELLADTALFKNIVDGIGNGNPYPNLRRTEIFDNEILLYLDGGRRFSLRMHLYGPNEYSPIHDHSAWGVTGCVNGRLGVLHYQRLDDGLQPGTAILRELGRRSLEPGEIETTHPLDRGIHATGADGADPVVMVSIYGSPMRRMHVNIYDPSRNRVMKAFPPRVRKRLLARSVGPFLSTPQT